MVLAGDLLGGERRPLAGRGVPELGVVDAPVHVDVVAPVELPPVARTVPSASVVRLNWRRPKAIGDVVETWGVVPLMSIVRAVFDDGPPPGDEDLADVIEGVAAVVPVLAVAARAEVLPCPAAGRIQLAQVVVGPRVEDAAIGRDVHPRIERHVHRRRLLGELADGAVRLADLGIQGGRP